MSENIRSEILNCLEHNAKIEVADIARLLNVSCVDVANEITAMEEEKIICGYLTLINWDKTDKELVTALIEVKVKPQQTSGFDAIAAKIAAFEEVDSIYLMSGGYDFMVLIEGETMKAVSSFVFDKLSTLDSIVSTATHFVLKKYKDHGTQLENIRKDKREIVL